MSERPPTRDRLYLGAELTTTITYLIMFLTVPIVQILALRRGHGGLSEQQLMLGVLITFTIVTLSSGVTWVLRLYCHPFYSMPQKFITWAIGLIFLSSFVMIWG